MGADPHLVTCGAAGTAFEAGQPLTLYPADHASAAVGSDRPGRTCPVMERHAGAPRLKACITTWRCCPGRGCDHVMLAIQRRSAASQRCFSAARRRPPRPVFGRLRAQNGQQGAVPASLFCGARSIHPGHAPLHALAAPKMTGGDRLALISAAAESPRPLASRHAARNGNGLPTFYGKGRGTDRPSLWPSRCQPFWRPSSRCCRRWRPVGFVSQPRAESDQSGSYPAAVK